MTTAQIIARARGALDLAQADLSNAIIEASNDAANKEAGMQIIDAVYNVLTEEHPELADMLHEGIQRLRGVRVEVSSKREDA